MQKRKLAVSILLSVIIIALGGLTMKSMISAKERPYQHTPDKPGALVDVLKVKLEDKHVMIGATGTVQSKRIVDMAPEVSGRVIYVAPDLLSGGYFLEGDTLFEIEPIDYELAAQKSRAQIARAEYELAQIESQARVARREWERIHLEEKEEPNPLVVYEPQLKNARAGLDSAKADLEQRLLHIERTKVKAPFNCMIKTERVEVGQYAMAGQGLLTIRGTDMAEIIIPVSFMDLQWLSIPRNNQNGSEATVKLRANGKVYQWEGAITRTLGEVDPKGRMIRLVVEIPDPYQLETPSSEDAFFLAEGLFVEVELKGKTLSDVFSIPSKALREDSFVWVMSSEKKLEVREVDVLWREKEVLLVAGNLHDNEDLILTYLSGAVPGMVCRITGETKVQ